MDFRLFDADNHYYEPADCFIRHADESVKRYVSWVTEGRKTHLSSVTTKRTTRATQTL